MSDVLLNVSNHLSSSRFVPPPIKLFSHEAELDDKVAGKILRLGLASFFSPKAQKSRLVLTHDDPGV